MPCKHNDFMESARRSFEAEKTSKLEIDSRNAASRAYYSAFLHARQCLKPLDLNELPSYDVDGGSHKKLRLAFSTSGHKSLKAIADTLDAAQKIRCRADYDINDAFVPEKARQQIQKCQAIHDRLDQAVTAVCKSG